MRKLLYIILLSCTLAFPINVKAQYYNVNYDVQTVAEMVAAFGTEYVVEMYYAQQIAKIREHYQAAEVAAAGIFASKYLDRKALTHLGLWTSSTENYYYRRIYNMVSAKIMPKIWTVAGMMLKSPQNAIYWGSYLYKICDEVKALCYQFESVVTNSSLSFRDIVFLEINQELASIFKLSELGGTDWESILDNFSDIGTNFTKDNLKEDIDNLYRMGVSLASAGASNIGQSILGGSNFNGTIEQQIGSVITIADNVYNIYNQLETNAGNTLLNLIGGSNGLANLFNISNYNTTSWLTDYAREGMGQYYTQRWYIYRVDAGTENMCDYYPPTDDDAIINGSHWTRFSTSDSNFYPSSSQTEQILQNSENHAGWSRSKVQQLNNSSDGFTYSMSYYRSAYIISKSGKQTKKAYAYEIHVTKSWNNQEVVYEDIFDSYSMDLNSFKASLNARLSEYNENEEGYIYYIGSDQKNYYQTTNAQKLAGCEAATISVTCHDGTDLGQGSTQYKCNDCGKTVNSHTRQCAMYTTATSTSVDTSELTTMEQEAQNHISMLESQINVLEEENAELIKKISSASVEEAAAYRQRYNANADKISSLKSELKEWQQQLSEIQQAITEAEEGEATSTDDYYRIPAIMQDCKTAYNLSWNNAGSWSGNTFIRTATMPNINGTITFSATVSIARKPKYFLGIKIHRAIVQISWNLSTEYSDTQVVAIVELDPNSTEQEKTDIVNEKISEVAQEYPECSVSVEYARSEPIQTDSTDDTYHLLWSSDRLEIAREIDTRLTKIFADLVSLEKMMHYKHSIVDILKSVLPYINVDEGRRLTIVEKCRKRWLKNAANSSHSDGYNGKYDDDEYE